MATPGTATWYFPLPRTHTGVPLGNGLLGLLAWGGEALHLTISRAGFWDHRGANPVLLQTHFQEVRRLLEADDVAGIRRCFGQPANSMAGTATEQPTHPQQYGGGRLELTFPNHLRPQRAELDFATGTLAIYLTAPDAPQAVVSLRLDPLHELAWLAGEADLLAHTAVVLRPAYETCQPPLAKLGIAPPRQWAAETTGGFVQQLPADDPLACVWQRRPGLLVLATALGPEAQHRATATATTADLTAAAHRADAWWRAYWADIPALRLPDAELQFAYDFGCYKQAGLTPPHAPAATLQGCWMEECQIPPWSNDYHFNINVQLVYSPAFATNRLEHLRPLWDLLAGWLPTLRQYGESFYRRPGALILPHAVDDRGHVVGSFWSGTIDQACAAWMAQLAWQHYRHTLDERILRELAWPLLTGAFEGYWAMLEPVPGAAQPTLALPVSVSPEFSGGTQRTTWGRDASFQLAALHLTARLLQQAAPLLGHPTDPRWAQVSRELPLYAAVPAGPPGETRIGLWHGVDLPRSHRHHSHLAGIWPFATLDPADAAHTRTIAHSLQRWAHLGAGEWTGWCVPWASILCARCNLPDAALAWLKWWQLVFTNQGHGTLHNADFPGVAAWHDGALSQPGFRKPHPFPNEIMQHDAGMAAVTAIAELLVQQRPTGLHVLPGLPQRWRDLEFDGVRTEGAFLVGATLAAGRLRQVRVTSLAGQPLRLCLPPGVTWRRAGQALAHPQVAMPTQAGETLCFEA